MVENPISSDDSKRLTQSRYNCMNEVGFVNKGWTVPVIMAAMVWGRQWSSYLVVVHCDNQVVVTIVNSGYRKDRDIMHMICCLFFIRAYWDFQLLAEDILGEHNKMANGDLAQQLSSFFSVSPEATQSPRLSSSG